MFKPNFDYLQTLPVNVKRPAKVRILRTAKGLRVLSKAGLNPYPFDCE